MRSTHLFPKERYVEPTVPETPFCRGPDASPLHQRPRGRSYVPMSVRGAQQEEQECHFRRGHMDNMTETRLEDQQAKPDPRNPLHFDGLEGGESSAEYKILVPRCFARHFDWIDLAAKISVAVYLRTG